MAICVTQELLENPTQKFMKPIYIYTVILMIIFIPLIFIFSYLEAAVFLLVVLHLSNQHQVERHKQYLHVFQVINDLRFFVAIDAIGISEESGAEKLEALEMTRLDDKQRARLYRDMDAIGM